MIAIIWYKNFYKDKQLSSKCLNKSDKVFKNKFFEIDTK